MKRLFYFVTGFLMIACNDSGDIISKNSVNLSPLYASIEDETTRTFMDDKIRIRWHEYDRISVFREITYNFIYEFDGWDGDYSGGFYNVTPDDRLVSGQEIDRIYALYPYMARNAFHPDGYFRYTLPTEQTYAENSFGKEANPMVAVTKSNDDVNLIFRNVGGYIRMFLYGDNITVKSIKLEGNNSEPLAGNIQITHNVYGGEPTTEVKGTNKSVTLICPDEGITVGSTEETATPFWFVIPPTDFTKGITVTVNGLYGEEFVKRYDANIKINRNKFKSTYINVNFPTQSGLSVGKNGWNNGGSYEGSAE